MNVNTLQEGLRTEHVGRSIIVSQAVTSTNDLAKELAALGAKDGTVILAETQTSARGRLNRTWVSPRGGLWFSTILRPRLEPSDAGRLTFAAGLAVAKTLRELYDLNTSTKWPNDVLVNGKKICGTLAEMSSSGQKTNYVILGIGVNANFEVRLLPEELWRNATSLRTELGKNVSLELLFRTLLEKLEYSCDRFMKKGFASILEEWKAFAEFLGARVELMNAEEKWLGFASDVDVDGSLILRLEDGTMKRFFAGDISVRIR